MRQDGGSGRQEPEGQRGDGCRGRGKPTEPVPSCGWRRSRRDGAERRWRTPPRPPRAPPTPPRAAVRGTARTATTGATPNVTPSARPSRSGPSGVPPQRRAACRRPCRGPCRRRRGVRPPGTGRPARRRPKGPSPVTATIAASPHMALPSVRQSATPGRRAVTAPTRFRRLATTVAPAESRSPARTVTRSPAGSVMSTRDPNRMSPIRSAACQPVARRPVRDDPAGDGSGVLGQHDARRTRWTAANAGARCHSPCGSTLADDVRAGRSCSTTTRVTGRSCDVDVEQVEVGRHGGSAGRVLPPPTGRRRRRRRRARRPPARDPGPGRTR